MDQTQKLLQSVVENARTGSDACEQLLNHTKDAGMRQELMTQRDQYQAFARDAEKSLYEAGGKQDVYITVLDEVNMTYSMCKTFSKYTFENLFNGYYLPVTIEEFVTGEYETPTCTLEGGLEQDNRFALTTGTVKANYSLDYVTMVITDEKGNEVFNHTMFPSVDRRLEDNSNDTHIRLVFMEYDLAHFSAPLAKVMFEKGGQYHATITGNLATGDSFVVKDFSFTNG